MKSVWDQNQPYQKETTDTCWGQGNTWWTAMKFLHALDILKCFLECDRRHIVAESKIHFLVQSWWRECHLFCLRQKNIYILAWRWLDVLITKIPSHSFQLRFRMIQIRLCIQKIPSPCLYYMYRTNTSRIHMDYTKPPSGWFRDAESQKVWEVIIMIRIKGKITNKTVWPNKMVS